MKTSRLIVAGIAAVATLGAFFLSGSPQPEPTPESAPVVQAPAMQTVDVLIAAVDVPMGAIVNAQDVRWSSFPKEGANAQFIIKEGDGEAEMKAVVGAIARYPFIASEPMRREKLIQANGSGFLSAILPPGKRAVAITTEPTGATTAGGFILPNDRVDIVRVFRDEEAMRMRGGSGGGEIMKSEIVVTNVRVLAIGQNVQERNGEKFITSQTATLELDPRQTEQVVLAQRQGTLALALRSLQDAAKNDERIDDGSSDRRPLTLVRFGVQSDLVAK